MMSIRRVAAATLIALAGVSLSGCPAVRNFSTWVGLRSAPQFVLPANMPEDFVFTLKSRDAAEPAVDYEFRFLRTGQVQWSVTVREPRRNTTDGVFEILDADLQKLYDALRDNDYADVEESDFPSLGDAGKKYGVQEFHALSSGTSHKIWLRNASLSPELANIRTAALSLVPTDVMKGQAPDARRNEPDHFIGDSLTRKLYASDSEDLKEVPAERRIKFDNYWDALNHQFDPVPALQKRMNP